MAQRQKIIRAELDSWKSEAGISPELHEQLAARYPARAWDLALLIRWTMVIGAILLGTGLISLLVIMFQSGALLAAILTALTAIGLVAGNWLSIPGKRRHLPKTGQALISLSCLLLGADILLLARLLAPEGEHWPPLILLISSAWFLIAYWQGNPAVLALALLGLAGWAGSESGYASGWGAYFLGLNYPLRFALISPLVVAIGYCHQRWLKNRFEQFVPVYYALGLLYTGLAFWILSIFGNHDEVIFGQLDYHGELLLWSLAWLAVSIGCFLIGARSGNRQFSGFGLTFIILNLYTRYFEYFWDDLDKWVFFIVLGLITLAGGILAERRLRSQLKPRTPANPDE